VRTAAETFVPNPRVNVAAVISQLAVGEALVSTLQENAVPMPVERTMMAPPRCRLGAITLDERRTVMARSPVGARYDVPVNRESAHELLTRRAAAAEPPSAPSPGEQRPAPRQPAEKKAGGGGGVSDILWGTGRRQGAVETMVKQAARTVGGQLGRQILRGVLGGILGGTRRR
jgi:hypothetical protein